MIQFIPAHARKGADGPLFADRLWVASDGRVLDAPWSELSRRGTVSCSPKAPAQDVAAARGGDLDALADEFDASAVEYEVSDPSRRRQC